VLTESGLMGERTVKARGKRRGTRLELYRGGMELGGVDRKAEQREVFGEKKRGQGVTGDKGSRAEDAGLTGGKGGTRRSYEGRRRGENREGGEGYRRGTIGDSIESGGGLGW
jgi:hypothetical protein